MKLIKNEFKVDAYEFKTPSGLEVKIIHKPGFKRSVAAYGVKFGALDIIQNINGETIHHKTGLAHFLEHKLFEEDKEDVLSLFTSLGASGNAFTSYDETVYYFSTNLDFQAPLDLLLKFVNRLQLTTENVEKEKGIIVEELKMYQKNPDMNLLMRTYNNVYHEFPLKYDIGGSIDDVNQTTLEDLKHAYELNYHPSKMMLVIISGEKPKIIKSWINDSLKSVNTNMDIQTVFKKEPLTCVKEFDDFSFDVQTPKVSLAFKFAYEGKNTLLDTYKIRLLLSLNFSELNDEYQNWLDNNIINSYFSYSVDLRDGFGVIFFFNEGDKNEKFIEIIQSKMNNLIIDEALFKQIKRRNYGQTIMALNSYDRFAINVMRSEFKGLNYFDYLAAIEGLKVEDIQDIKQYINNCNISITNMNSKL